jgi:hypothetical protein
VVEHIFSLNTTIEEKSVKIDCNARNESLHDNRVLVQSDAPSVRLTAAVM